MNPGEQRRVAGLIGRAVFILAAHPQVDPLHFCDQPFGVGGGTKGGGGNKLAGTAQAAKDIFAEV